MTIKLSYPGLRCVLEYLEANRRIHITARSPALRRIEKSIPIHLEFLQIEGYKIDLNYMVMGVYSANGIQFKKGKKKQLRQFPMDLTREKAMEKLNEYYLGGRMNIYADNFEVSNSQVESFPKFNVTTNELTVYDFVLKDILQYINPNSFPLKQLSIDCDNDMNNPHICSAKSLHILIMDDDEKHENAANIVSIQNKNVDLSYKNLEFMDVMGVIQYWMENGKEVGTTFAFYACLYEVDDEIELPLRNEFNEIMRELTGVDDQNLTGTTGFSIPLNSSSNIFVYRPKNACFLDEEIVLKVVSNQADGNTMEMEH